MPEVTVAVAAGIGVPVVSSESPRGVNDPSLGAFAEVLCEADLIVLLGKKLDFTLRFAREPVVNRGCRFLQIDAESSALEQRPCFIDINMDFFTLLKAARRIRVRR